MRAADVVPVFAAEGAGREGVVVDENVVVELGVAVFFVAAVLLVELALVVFFTPSPAAAADDSVFFFDVFNEVSAALLVLNFFFGAEASAAAAMSDTVARILEELVDFGVVKDVQADRQFWQTVKLLRLAPTMGCLPSLAKRCEFVASHDMMEELQA